MANLGAIQDRQTWFFFFSLEEPRRRRSSRGRKRREKYVACQGFVIYLCRGRR
ncbi:hypothetical protein OIU78_005782 [Salix suchowensis]|nr:hypothetical protein OIU78_005782 [Salix suchowensis]